MMNYKMFKEIVKEQFLNYMPDDFKEHKVDIHSVNKVNQKLDGLSLIPPDNSERTVCPTIYINHMYESYLKEGNLQDALALAAFDLAASYRAVPKNIESINADSAKERVVMMLVNTEQNREMLKEVPHREFQDLSIVYRYVAEKGKDGTQTALVTDGLAEMFGMTEQQLYEAAVVNTKKLFPPEVKTMNEVIREIFIADGMPEQIADMMIGEIPPEQMMYIVSNDCRINGAVSMLYETELHNLAESLGSDLYILPSSIHEVIAVPASGNDPAELAQMVSEVNISQVPLSERLSNQVYHYDKDLRRLSLATDTPNKRLDGIVAEPPMIYETKQSR